MKWQTQNTESFLHAYGCGAILSGEEWIEHEASLMAELWDQLVDIERRFERGIEAAASQDDPVIRETLAAIETLSAGIAAASPTERKPLVEQQRNRLEPSRRPRCNNRRRDRAEAL